MADVVVYRTTITYSNKRKIANAFYVTNYEERSHLRQAPFDTTSLVSLELIAAPEGSGRLHGASAKGPGGLSASGAKPALQRVCFSKADAPASVNGDSPHKSLSQLSGRTTRRTNEGINEQVGRTLAPPKLLPIVND